MTNVSVPHFRPDEVLLMAVGRIHKILKSKFSESLVIETSNQRKYKSKMKNFKPYCGLVIVRIG